MPTTETPAASPAPEPAAEPLPAPAADERARAKAYLDRWERHLVRVALDGPLPAPGRPPAG